MSRAKMLLAETLFRHAPGLLPLRLVGAYSGTGKASLERIGLYYFEVYEHYLRPLKRTTFSLLELGVYRGESLRAWQAYFRRAKIIGLDIDPEAANRALGFKVFTGSQSDPAVIDQALREAGENLRVVIDDASHLNALTVASFDLIFPRLPSGALYFIEDLAPVSYEAASREWPGFSGNSDLDMANDRVLIDSLVRDLVHDVDRQPVERWSGSHLVSFVHAWPGMLVIGRA